MVEARQAMHFLLMALLLFSLGCSNNEDDNSSLNAAVSDSNNGSATEPIREERIRELVEIMCRSGEIHETGEAQVPALTALKQIISAGRPAISILSAELTHDISMLETSDRLPYHLIPFALRVIDEPEAVPALIRALKDFKYHGEYGIYVKDPSLAEFMIKHQYRPPADNDLEVGNIRLGCMVLECTSALEKITGHTEGHDHLRPRTGVECQEVAARWQAWWDQNKQKFSNE